MGSVVVTVESQVSVEHWRRGTPQSPQAAPTLVTETIIDSSQCVVRRPSEALIVFPQSGPAVHPGTKPLVGPDLTPHSPHPTDLLCSEVFLTTTCGL